MFENVRVVEVRLSWFSYLVVCLPAYTGVERMVNMRELYSAVNWIVISFLIVAIVMSLTFLAVLGIAIGFWI